MYLTGRVNGVIRSNNSSIEFNEIWLPNDRQKYRGIHSNKRFTVIKLFQIIFIKILRMCTCTQNTNTLHVVSEWKRYFRRVIRKDTLTRSQIRDGGVAKTLSDRTICSHSFQVFFFKSEFVFATSDPCSNHICAVRNTLTPTTWTRSSRILLEIDVYMHKRHIITQNLELLSTS